MSTNLPILGIPIAVANEMGISDGDIVTFNQSPILDHTSIRSMQAQVVAGNELVLPEPRAMYNADFDGDEMNMHVPEDQLEAAVAVVTGVPPLLLTPQQQLIRAIHFATVAHQMQRRKGRHSLPYIQHPLNVLQRLSDAGVMDVDVLMGAVSHDVLEDTDKTAEELGAVIGQRALAFVQECSDDKSLDKVTRKKLQIKHASRASIGAKQIKLGDKLSNLYDLATDSPTHWTSEELQGYRWWSLAVIRACGSVAQPRLYAELIELLAHSGVVYESQHALEQQLVQYYAHLHHSE